MAEREEPVLAKQSHASTSPEPHDKEAASTSMQPQENLDKDFTKPEEEPAAATTTTLVEHPVYFVSTVLRDARERYPMQQKLLFSLLSASRKLRHYFQGHLIKVVTSYPLEQVLHNPNATDRVASWASSCNPSSWNLTPQGSSRAERWLISWPNGRIHVKKSLKRKRL